MKSIDERKQELVKDILFMKKATPEQIRKITLDGMSCYGKALGTFGFKSPVRKEALRVIKEMYEISKIEGRLLDFILENLNSFDITSAENVVLDLDKLNDATYASYDEILGEIETACEMKKEERALRPNRQINSLLTNNSYQTMVLALTKKMSDVKKFLNYEDEFWEFIKDHLKVEPSPAYIAEKTCGLIPILDWEKNLVNFYTIVPKVTDLETAMIAIDIYKRAHDLYSHVGHKYEDVLKTDGKEVANEYKMQLEEEAQQRFK